MLQAGLATMLALSSAVPVMASEVDVLSEPTPVTKAAIDDTEKLWGSTFKTITEDAKAIKVRERLTAAASYYKLDLAMYGRLHTTC